MSRLPVRRSQAISPFGVGALVDFPGPVSLVHASLDAWGIRQPDHEEFFIRDEARLARRLGVDYFVRPPDFREPESASSDDMTVNLKLPFLRFPLWHVCPQCRRMECARYHDVAAPKCDGPLSNGSRHSKRSMMQVRFVAACANGHLQDFPWIEWLFRENAKDFNPESMWLRLRGRGSASLRGVEISCEAITSQGHGEVLARRTLAGAFTGDASALEPSALSRIGVTCKGSNPAQAIPRETYPAPGCGEHLYPLLRGAANLYFAHVVSSIFIPEITADGSKPEVLELLEDPRVRRRLEDAARDADNGLVSHRAAENILGALAPQLRGQVDGQQLAEAANRQLLPLMVMRNATARGYIDQSLRTAGKTEVDANLIGEVLRNQFSNWAIDPSVLAKMMNAHLARGSESGGSCAASLDGDESDFRRQEYAVLRQDIDEGRPRRNLLIRSHAISSYGSVVDRDIGRVSLAHKLRETRAFGGFSRLFPEDGLSSDQRWKLIAERPLNWLPAIEVRGEGIFLEFREERISSWLQSTRGLGDRLARMNDQLAALRQRRHQPLRKVSPRFVMLHTLAHSLINQLVYDCGYGSAALRERIYAADAPRPMAGILVYTAAGDSEGTMGGLVSMGEPGRLEGVLARAIDRARWCSSDPICTESGGQGPDSCNLAACHSCALLPETACEEQNRLLDRAMMVGTIESPEIGFFSSGNDN